MFSAGLGGLLTYNNMFVVRVAAERGDVALNPARCRLLVEIAEVGRRVGVLRRNFGVAEEAEHIYTIVHRDNHQAAAREAFAVKLHLSRVTDLQTAAIVPDEDREVFIRALGRRPDV